MKKNKRQIDNFTKVLILVVDVGTVVTVAVENGVVVVVVVDDRAGFQMLNTQNVGSLLGADSGPLFFFKLDSNCYQPN